MSVRKLIPKARAETIKVFAVRDGGEHYAGRRAIPPSVKAREILRRHVGESGPDYSSAKRAAREFIGHLQALEGVRRNRRRLC
jgi:hypothetical protein